MYLRRAESANRLPDRTLQQIGEQNRAASVMVEARIVDRELHPDRVRMVDERREQLDECRRIESAGLGRIDERHERGIERIDVEVNEEIALAEMIEHFRGRRRGANVRI